MLSLIILAIGLSMDTFAVSLAEGVMMRPFQMRKVIKMALSLALFQATMPVIGWLLGESVQSLIDRYDHWVAFGILIFLGGKMILDSFTYNKANSKECEQVSFTSTNAQLIKVSFATSIDALAVGFSFALLNTNIVMAYIVIFIITFLFCVLGNYIGKEFGKHLQRWSELIGGVVLVAIGIKILLEGLD